MNAILAKLIPGLLGDKTSSVIGVILGYIIYAYADFSSIVPAKYAPYVSGAIATLSAVFGAYVIRPGHKNAPDVVAQAQ